MTTVLDGMEEFDGVLTGVVDVVKTAEYEETLEDFQPVIAEQHAGMFAGEYDSNLIDWAPLKPSTIKRKGHDRILIETGALRRSLVAVGGPGNVNAVAERGLLFGTDVEYALFHQEGTRKMPARPPVGLAEETLDKLVNRVADATVEKLREGR